jgi:hypothetical protein
LIDKVSREATATLSHLCSFLQLTQKHAAVVQEIAQVLKHGTLILATGAAKVA